MNTGSGASTSLEYRDFVRSGTDGLVGWSLTGVQGMDVHPTPGLAGGIFARLRYLNIATTDGTGALTTLGYGVGARTAIALGPTASLRGAFLYEYGENTALADGATGDFTSDRVMGQFALTDTHWAGPFRFAPTVSLRYEETWRDAYVDSASTAVPASHLRLGRLSATQEVAFSQAVAGAPGGHLVTIHPYLVGGVDWDFVSDAGYAADEAALFDPGAVVFRGGGGLRVHWSDRAWLSLSGEYFGSGDTNGYRLNAELSLPLGPDRRGAVGSLRIRGSADQSGAASASARAVVPLN